MQVDEYIVNKELVDEDGLIRHRVGKSHVDSLSIEIHRVLLKTFFYNLILGLYRRSKFYPLYSHDMQI